MAISRISSASNNGTTITLGTHAKGDTILYFAYNNGTGGSPTLPASVIGLHSSASRVRIGYYIADSDSVSVGTSGWTNATNVTAVVYRGGSSSIVVPTSLSFNSNTSTTITYLAQPANTFKDQALDLWLLGYLANRVSTNNLGSNSPTGMSNVRAQTDTGYEVAVYDTNATRTTAWASTSVTLATSAAYYSYVFELQEVETRITGGGGIFFRPGMSGGMSE